MLESNRMGKFTANGKDIFVGPIQESGLSELIKELKPNKIVILSDENTHENCNSYLVTSFDELSEAEIMVLPAGEGTKDLDIAQNLWLALTDYEVSRHDLIINVGGGVITDLGGFVASCYKRGVKFINISTSLLGMVDASIGGKTGINLDGYKNQVGTFSFPELTIIDPIFLSTLEPEEWLNGFAEMLKHGLIADKQHFEEVLELMESEEWSMPFDLLETSLKIKVKITDNDPFEMGERKLLNFGHTIGHAIESHQNKTGYIPHGMAVGAGMIIESYLSYKKGLLKQEDFEAIDSELSQYYPLPDLNDRDIQELVSLLYNDKKNRNGMILCVLLDSIGHAVADIEITSEEVLEAFFHFKNQRINLN